MCGRFTLANPAAAFNAMPWLRDIPTSPPRYNIAPGQHAFVICYQSGPVARMARWGFRKSWPGAAPELLINARSEKVGQTPSFSESFRHRRCVIPADGFYEWRKAATSAEPFLFQLKSGKPFCLAGLYDDSADSLTFVVLTTTANTLVKRVHFRMPVMMDPPEAMAYISAPSDDLETQQLFRPFPASRMISHRVKNIVNRVSNDSPSCMEPYHPLSTQQGELF